jgi:energy-coupling factor transport system ATP-binding protein
MTTSADIRFEGVTFRYKSGVDSNDSDDSDSSSSAGSEADSARPALIDVDCQVEAGTFVGITGPSDAGKSSFCRCLSGFVPHFFDGDLDGSVSIAGTDVPESSIGELGETVGYVFEDPFDQLTGAATTVLEEVAFGLERIGTPREDIEPRARECLDRVGIEALADRDPGTLSGGQLQRLAIASVLALDPGILVLDEPTSQLDPAGTEAVFDLAESMHEAGYTICLVSQDLHRLAPRADRLLVLGDGRLRYDDDPRTVLTAIEEASEASEASESNGSVTIPGTLRIGRALRERGLFDGDLPLTVAELEVGTDIEALRSTNARRASSGEATTPAASTPSNSAAAVPPESESGTSGSNTPESAVSEANPPNSDPSDSASPPASASSDDPPLIDVENASHTYASGTDALADVSLSMDGGCVAILGHNGAGKTTLAKQLNGLLTPTSGTVRIAGRDTSEAPVARLAREVGLCFQNPDDQLFRPTVESELRFGPERLGYDEARVDELVEEALAVSGLDAVRDTDTYDLGRAQRGRVAIASVLAMDTPAVVLDEPTGGQDSSGVSIVGDIVDDCRSAGRLVVLVTHDVGFAAEHADRLVVLADGAVIADGPPRAVFDSDRAAIERAGVTIPVATRAASVLGLGEDVLSVGELLSRLDTS